MQVASGNRVKVGTRTEIRSLAVTLVSSTAMSALFRQSSVDRPWNQTRGAPSSNGSPLCCFDEHTKRFGIRQFTRTILSSPVTAATSPENGSSNQTPSSPGYNVMFGNCGSTGCVSDTRECHGQAADSRTSAGAGKTVLACVNQELQPLVIY